MSTALSFALGNGRARAAVLFGLAVGVTAVLVLLRRAATRLLTRVA